ncbi:MAG: signal peptidase I [Patescibacteria group bacterium]
MSTGVFFQSLPSDKQIRRRIHPTFSQEVREYAFYFLKVFVSVALIYLFIRTSVFDVIGISGKSMYPTYDNKDAIYIDQLTPKFSDYRRGDVVVLLSPAHLEGQRDLYIKRVIGLPGDIVILEDGKVFIENDNYPNGVQLDENYYLNPTVPTYKKLAISSDKFVEEKLQDNEYYVMGDNRTASSDSRYFGKVNKSDILGKEFYRIIPPSKAGFFELPSYNIPN